MRIHQTLGWPADELNAVWWLADGQNLATASDDGSIRLWDCLRTEPKIDHVLNGHDSPVKDVLSTSRGLLVAGSADCTLSIWDLSNHSLIKRIEGFRDWVRGLSCSPDELRVAVASADQTLQVFSLETFSLIKKVTAHEDFIRGVSWSHDGKHIATVSADGWFKVWDAIELKIQSCLKFELGLTCVKWAPDSRSVAVAGVERTVNLVDPYSSKLIMKLAGHKDAILSLAWPKRNPEYLVSGSADNSIRVWHLASKTCLQVAEGHRGSIRGLAWSSVSDRLASVSTDRSLRIWTCLPVNNGVGLWCETSAKARNKWVRSAAYNSKTSIMAMGMEDRAIELFKVSPSLATLNPKRMEGSTEIGFEGDGKSATVIRRKRQRVEEWVRCIAWHPDAAKSRAAEFSTSGYIAIASDDTGVSVLKVDYSHLTDSSQELETVSSFSNPRGGHVSCIAWSNSGEYLTIGTTNSIYIWRPFRCVPRATEDEQTLELNGHRDRVLSIAWERGDNILVSSSSDLSILRWNLAHESFDEYQSVDCEILSLAISSDKCFIAGAGADSCIYIWNFETLNLARAVKLHNDVVVSVKWSDDCNYLISASRNGCVKVLNVKAWNIVWEVPAPTIPRVSLEIDLAYDDTIISFDTEMDFGEMASIRTLVIPSHSRASIIVRKLFSATVKNSNCPQYSTDVPAVQIDLPSQKIPDAMDRQLKIFVSYSREDREQVYPIYQRLKKLGFSPWIDEMDALPGTEWREEIPKVVRLSDIVLVCMTSKSTRKRGYLQKEIRTALEAAEERPHGDIYIIPVRLEECEIPTQLATYSAVDVFRENGYQSLINSLIAKLQLI